MAQHQEHCEHCGMSMAAHTAEGAEEFAEIAECPRMRTSASREGRSMTMATTTNQAWVIAYKNGAYAAKWVGGSWHRVSDIDHAYHFESPDDAISRAGLLARNGEGYDVIRRDVPAGKMVY